VRGTLREGFEGRSGSHASRRGREPGSRNFLRDDARNIRDRIPPDAFCVTNFRALGRIPWRPCSGVVAVCSCWEGFESERGVPMQQAGSRRAGVRGEILRWQNFELLADSLTASTSQEISMTGSSCPHRLRLYFLQDNEGIEYGTQQ
jgi:hypothetical protein